jgi:hypothetical protein
VVFGARELILVKINYNKVQHVKSLYENVIVRGIHIYEYAYNGLALRPPN